MIALSNFPAVAASRVRSRGVAMLVVITILVTMVLVALPFALSMNQGKERTRAVGSRARARYEAETLLELTKLHLVAGTAAQEQARWDQGMRSVDAMSDVDSLDEIAPGDQFRKTIEGEIIQLWEKEGGERAARAQYLKSRGLGPMNDDRGSIWTVLIEDAQARVNVNGGQVFLLANLMGSAILSDELDTGGGDISVEHVVTGRFGGLQGFDPKGGYIRIGREVIRYQSFDGEAFRSCERGMLMDTPLLDNGTAEPHAKGTPVIDYTAYKIATHLIAAQAGQLTPFGNLEALRSISGWGEGGVLAADRLERVLPYLTAWSRRENSAPWLADQLIVNELPASVDGTDPDEVQVRDFRNNPSGTTTYLNPGTILRFSDGVQTVYQVLDKVGDLGDRRRDGFFTTAGSIVASVPKDKRDKVKFKGGETRVAAFAPYPININTASREVLYAVMANVQLWRAEGKEQIVTPELAWRLAGEIVDERKGGIRAEAENGNRQGGPFRHAEDFGRWLEAKVKGTDITRAQQAALYMNAINPNSAELRFGTAPWSFRTLDVYHVEARVALNNRVGEQIAEASVREVVEIGSDTTATWSLDSQDDFDSRLAMGSGAKWVTTYPFGVALKSKGTHHIQPALRGPKSIVNGIYPGHRREGDTGDVRLEPVRMLLPGAQVEDHFDTNHYADGHFTGYDQAYIKKVKEFFQGRNDQRMRPFSMSFWWRPYGPSDWTVFDAGIEPHVNRFALFVQEGQEGPELTFRCAAGTLWKQSAEVYVPMEQLDFQPGSWYHLHVSCIGEDPATMQLLVDGVDIGRRRGLTRLSGSITADSEEIPVESTAGFPVRGSIRIGTEIIEYDTLSDTAFRDCFRGQRGTTALEFPGNTPVYANGYSMPLTVDVMKGGATLRERLGKWSALRISTMNGGQPAPDTVTVTVDGLPTPVILAGFGPDTTNITVTGVGMWGQDDSQGADAFPSKGIALMGCPQVGNASGGDVQLGGWEVMYYERNGNDFTVERFIDTAWQGAATPYFLITENRTAQLEFPAFLVPISVLASGTTEEGSDYLDPADATQEEILTRYHNDTASGHVALSTDLQPEGELEIIRYDSIDRKRASPDLLFVRDRSIGALTNHFFGDSQTIDGGTSVPDTDPPVPPPDTDPPVPPPVPPGEDPGLPPGDGPGGGPEEPSDPTPGDGLPPGARQPTDPGDDGGEPTDPGSGDPGGEDPGSGDDGPLPSGGSGGTGSSGDGEGEDGEPLDPADNSDPADGPGAGEGLDSEGGGDESEGGFGAGGAVDPGARPGGEEDTAGDPPPEEEPLPDDSGGGADQGEEEEGDAKIPAVPPGARDPSDSDGTDEENGDMQGGGDVWEPEGPLTAAGLARFRGFVGDVPQQLDGGGEAPAARIGLEHNGSSGDRLDYFLPCFRAWENYVAAPVARTGRNDVITITDGGETPVRMEVGIRWGDPASNWVALDDWVEQRFEAPKDGATTPRNDPRGRPRILRFPCGELPDEMSEDIEFGQSRVSGASLVTAFLDELFVWRHTHDTVVVVNNAEGLLETGEEIYLARTGSAQDLTTLDGYDSDCGLILIGDELVAYRSTRQEGDTTLILEGCERGILGTRPGFHAIGERVRFLPDIPVSYLDAGITVDASTVPLARTRGWPQEGTARILREDTAEFIHYTRLADRELIMPTSLDNDDRTRDRGLFRGRYGTDATDHDSREIVVFQPFRYWDRYTPRRSQNNESFAGVHDHPECSYLELGLEARSALWRGFTWEENILGRTTGSDGVGRDDASEASSPWLDIIVVGRFNPHIPWDSEQVVDLREEQGMGRRKDFSAMKDSHLFVVDGPGSGSIGNSLFGHEFNVQADKAEFRFYFVYKPNAIEPMDAARRDAAGLERPVLRNAWKQSPWLESFSVNYFNRSHTLYKAAVR
ncbi:MAG: hypothetical protein O2894_09670 [Planctomycetota bacterium]|nr:hypothetical protein [Planctomycetota bacterium]